MKRTHSERRKVTTRSTVRRVRKVPNPPIFDSANEFNATPHRSAKRSNSDTPRRTRESSFSTPTKASLMKEEDKDSFSSTDSTKTGLDFTASRTGSDSSHRCKICGCEFERANLLKSHLIEHGNERAFPCFLCGVRFTTKWNLMKHQKSRSHRAAQSRDSVHSSGETKLRQIIPLKKRKISWEESGESKPAASYNSNESPDNLETTAQHRSTTICVNVIPFTSPIATQLQLEKLHELDRTTKPSATVPGTLTLDLPMTEPIQLAVSLTYQDVKRCVTGLRSKISGQSNGFDSVMTGNNHSDQANDQKAANGLAIQLDSETHVTKSESSKSEVNLNTRCSRVDSPAPSTTSGEELCKRSQEEIQAARTILFLAHSGEPCDEAPDDPASSDTEPSTCDTDRPFIPFTPSRDAESDRSNVLIREHSNLNPPSPVNELEAPTGANVPTHSSMGCLPSSNSNPIYSSPSNPITICPKTNTDHTLQPTNTLGLSEQIHQTGRVCPSAIRPPPKKRLSVQYQGSGHGQTELEKSNIKQPVTISPTPTPKPAYTSPASPAVSTYVTVVPVTPSLSTLSTLDLNSSKTAFDIGTSQSAFWNPIQVTSLCMRPPSTVFLPLASSATASPLVPSFTASTVQSLSLAGSQHLAAGSMTPSNPPGLFILPQLMVLPRFVGPCVPMVSSQPVVSPSCFVVQPEAQPWRLSFNTSTVTDSVITPIPATSQVGATAPRPLKAIAPATSLHMEQHLCQAMTIVDDHSISTNHASKLSENSADLNREGASQGGTTDVGSPPLTGTIPVSLGCKPLAGSHFSPLVTTAATTDISPVAIALKTTTTVAAPTALPTACTSTTIPATVTSPHSFVMATSSTTATENEIFTSVPSTKNITDFNVTPPVTAALVTSVLTEPPEQKNSYIEPLNSSNDEQSTSVLSVLSSAASSEPCSETPNSNGSNNSKSVKPMLPYRPLLSKASSLQRTTEVHRGSNSSMPFSRLVANRNKYRCCDCGMMCHKRCLLRKHYRTHSNVRPFMCQHCDVSFKTRGNLSKHMKSRVHRNRCIQELGFVQAPMVVDDATQVDQQALERQRLLVMRKDHHNNHHHYHLHAVKREIRETRFRAIRANPTAPTKQLTSTVNSKPIGSVPTPNGDSTLSSQQSCPLTGVLRKSVGRRRKAPKQNGLAGVSRLVNLQPRPIGSIPDPTHRVPAPNVNAVHLLQDFPLNLSVRPTQPTVLLRYATDTANVSNSLLLSSSTPTCTPAVSQIPIVPTASTVPTSSQWPSAPLEVVTSCMAPKAIVNAEAMIQTAIAAARNFSSDRVSPSGSSTQTPEDDQNRSDAQTDQPTSAFSNDAGQNSIQAKLPSTQLPIPDLIVSSQLMDSGKDTRSHRKLSELKDNESFTSELQSTQTANSHDPSSFVDLDEINSKRDRLCREKAVERSKLVPSKSRSSFSNAIVSSPESTALSGLPVVAKKFVENQQSRSVGDRPRQCDPRPYKCLVCDIGFRVMGHLHKHYRAKSHLNMVLQSEHLPVDSVDCVRQSRMSTSQFVNPENGQLRPRATERIAAMLRQAHSASSTSQNQSMHNSTISPKSH